jgi:hypothetical protein|tara:strand:+ start:114 stop:308 length:195 start_codon:yes stop_codon:yes gene_type:complete
VKYKIRIIKNTIYKNDKVKFISNVKLNTKYNKIVITNGKISYLKNIIKFDLYLFELFKNIEIKK